MKCGLRFSFRRMNIRAKKFPPRVRPEHRLSGQAAHGRENMAQRGEGLKRKKRALDDAAERLGWHPSRQRFRAAPIRPADVLRSGTELGFHAVASLGLSGGWDGPPLRRIDGEDSALTGEAAAHARAGQGPPFARWGRAGRPKRARPAGDGRGLMRRPAASAIGRNGMAAASPKRRIQPEWPGAGRNQPA